MRAVAIQPVWGIDGHTRRLLGREAQFGLLGRRMCLDRQWLIDGQDLQQVRQARAEPRERGLPEHAFGILLDELGQGQLDAVGIDG